MVCKRGTFEPETQMGSSSCQCSTILMGQEKERMRFVLRIQKVKTYAQTCSQGHWTFFGPGDEKKWYGKSKYPPDGKWNSLASQMVQRFKETSHPGFLQVPVHWVVEVWERWKEKKRYTSMRMLQTHTTLVPNHSFCESAQLLRSSLNLVWRVRPDNGRKRTRKTERIRDQRCIDKCEITRNKTFGIPPKLVSGSRLRENSQDFESLSETVQFTKFCELASIWNRVSAGVSYKTQADEDDGLGDPIPLCREYTLPRANPQSIVYAAIPGETIIGPIIEVHVVQIFGTHGLEIEIPSPNNPKRTSWVLISRGKIRFVDGLHIPDVRHSLTIAELLSEHETANESEPCWRNPRLALRKLVRRLILAPGNWKRTLSVILPAQRITHKEPYLRRKGNGKLFLPVHRTVEDLLQQRSPFWLQDWCVIVIKKNDNLMQQFTGTR